MITKQQIEEMFHYSTEIKDTLAEQKEKNNRRFETICIKVKEVRESIYTLNKGIVESMEIVNAHYSSILSNEDILEAINELRALHVVISNPRFDLMSKATVINVLELKKYKKLTHICKLNGLKTLSRLSNMNTLSTKYLNGLITKKAYSADLKEQAAFFGHLLEIYEDISKDNFYIYLLRYDLKTVKKRQRVFKNPF